MAALSDSSPKHVEDTYLAGGCKQKAEYTANIAILYKSRWKMGPINLSS